MLTMLPVDLRLLALEVAGIPRLDLDLPGDPGIDHARTDALDGHEIGISHPGATQQFIGPLFARERFLQPRGEHGARSAVGAQQQPLQAPLLGDNRGVLLTVEPPAVLVDQTQLPPCGVRRRSALSSRSSKRYSARLVNIR